MLIEFGKYQVYFCKKRNKTSIFSFVLWKTCPLRSKSKFLKIKCYGKDKQNDFPSGTLHYLSLDVRPLRPGRGPHNWGHTEWDAPPSIFPVLSAFFFLIPLFVILHQSFDSCPCYISLPSFSFQPHLPSAVSSSLLLHSWWFN